MPRSISAPMWQSRCFTGWFGKYLWTMGKGLGTCQGCSPEAPFCCCRPQVSFGFRKRSCSHTPHSGDRHSQHAQCASSPHRKCGPNASACHSWPSAIPSPWIFPIETTLSGILMASLSLHTPAWVWSYASSSSLPEPKQSTLAWLRPGTVGAFDPRNPPSQPHHPLNFYSM